MARQNASGYDLIIANGVWQYVSLATWIALRSTETPYFIFPHGMLDPWFEHAYPLKHIKKRLYWFLGEYRVLRDARAVLFTSEEERIQAGVRLGRIIAATSFKQMDRWGRLATQMPCARSSSLCFLNCVRNACFCLWKNPPKKGCDLLIDAFASVAQLDPDLHLVFAGPDQTGWIRQLQGESRNWTVGESNPGQAWSLAS